MRDFESLDLGSNPSRTLCVLVAQYGLERSAFNRVAEGSNPSQDNSPHWRNWIARQTSNLKVVGSNPT